ncbi:MAG: serine/threonine protein kinase [Deltaproteobacteria bacterium]|nr:serine/threonine protein kinase [Deltaproteobacteria bacterium]
MGNGDEVQKFIRCPHCGLPHASTETMCPIEGKPIERPAKSNRNRASQPGPPSVPPPTPSQRPPDWRPSPGNLTGRTLEGKYKIEEMIGRGAMGTVYRGRHSLLQRVVAIKVISRGHSPGSEAEQRFYREARIAGSIGHPNIAEVFDLGTLEDGSPFIVMPYLEGETLAERIRRVGALPLVEAFEIAARVVSALVATHAKGIVHRDLKPENVFLARQDGGTLRVQLLDFGISKDASEDELGLTSEGVVIGTPYYLAPEQARGQRDVDHRTDIYAAGVLLYEMLTGRLPLQADNYNAQLMLIVGHMPEPPSKIRPEIPEAADAVVATAMAKSPADRYQTAREMLEAIGFVHSLARPAPAPNEDATEVSDSFIHFDLKLPKTE